MGAFPYQSLSVQMPFFAKAEMSSGRRVIYFETSREGVTDREGEDIAADALWNSRNLFLEQGDLDISHWSKLGNPPGSGARPEYIVGVPLEVERAGPSIFVKGEIFNPTSPPPEGSQGHYANMLWHSLTEQSPPGRWYPSVFGFIAGDSKRGDGAYLDGRIEWTSVGFAQRAQHPELPAVNTTPVGPFGQAGTLQMNYATFAKAVQAAGAQSALDGAASLTGVQAIQRESLDPTKRDSTLAEGYTALYKRARKQVLEMIRDGKIKPTISEVANAFTRCGVPLSMAHDFAHRLERTGRKIP